MHNVFVRNWPRFSPTAADDLHNHHHVGAHENGDDNDGGDNHDQDNFKNDDEEQSEQIPTSSSDKASGHWLIREEAKDLI